MKYILSVLLFLAAVSCNEPVSLELVSPSAAGMSAARLDRIDSLLNRSIADGYVNGGVALIARDGKTVYEKAFGTSDRENNVPMQTNAIFRIASQTKAITSVGVMILCEEGKIVLDDPVSKYIPEFAHPAVLNTFNPKDSSYTTVPANREITVRDLLTHTSGIDYAVIGSENMRAIYAKAGIPVGFESRSLVLGDEIRKLGKLPLVHQPGLAFTYGLNCDVLGYLIEVVSGMRFDRFLHERIFMPLGMGDTYFYLPDDRKTRLVPAYTVTSEGELVKIDTVAFGGMNINYPLTKGTYFSGGAGLSSTARDYAIFLQMLLNGGTYNGSRILSRRTVEMMTTNQIGDLNLGVNKFGLGFEITTAAGQAKTAMSEGSFAWGGYFSTTYWADPEEKLIGLLFFQQSPMLHPEIEDAFKMIIYGSITDVSEGD